MSAAEALAGEEARRAEERAALRSAEALPWGRRTLAYLRLGGPGYLQSAMTLGGGTASASLFAGAAFGYQLLWVPPLAMAMGVVMLSAVSYQTLSTGMRPFEAVRRFAGAPFAWAWAAGALLASILWHFPHYALASALVVDIGDALGAPGIPPMVASFALLGVAVALTLTYGRSSRATRIYERLLRWMVWAVVFCFAAVVWRTGIRDPGGLLRGFFAFHVPAAKSGVSAVTTVLSGLSAAVGVNMLFLYPYSLLEKGWGREHRRLARYDLVLGMFVPYVLATTLMIVAMANTVHLNGEFSGTALSPKEAAQALAALFGDTLGRVVFNLGVLAMALSSITLHMVSAGFVGCELFGLTHGSWKHRLAMLLPIPGVLGPLLWSEVSVWILVPTNIVCGLFLPATYFAFVRLQRSRAYLGSDVPRGPRARVWWGVMLAVTLFLGGFLGWYVVTQLPGYWSRLGIG